MTITTLIIPSLEQQRLLDDELRSRIESLENNFEKLQKLLNDRPASGAMINVKSATFGSGDFDTK